MAGIEPARLLASGFDEPGSVYLTTNVVSACHGSANCSSHKASA